MKKNFVFSLCAVMTIFAACNESDSWKAVCADNETRCDGSQLMICQNTQWSEKTDCTAEGKSCGNNNEGKATCLELSSDACMQLCKDGKATRCDNGKAIMDTCGENEVCGFDENGTPACVAKKECVTSCKDGQLTTCDHNLAASTKKCGENEVCGVDENGAPACVAKKACVTSCIDGQLTTCDHNLVVNTKKCGENEVCGFDENGAPACVAKSAVVVCKFGQNNLLAGQKACDENSQVVTCQDDGSMSAGAACEKGICIEGTCVRRDCGDITDGQNGCKDGNIVVCNDGVTSVIEGGNCIDAKQKCIADTSAEAGFSCKTPHSGDCEWQGGLIAKNEVVCDDNVLRTCSAEADGVLSEGVDCAVKDSSKPYCDPKLNICRAYFNCGNVDEIKHGEVACNAKGTNKAKCSDGKLVDLTDENACAIVAHADSICTYETEAVCSFACKTGYILVNGECQAIEGCTPIKEIYDPATNSCACNEDENWTGEVGSCTCKAGTVLIGNMCEPKAVCDQKIGQTYIEKANICGCDGTKGWLDKGSSCECAPGLSNRAGVCEVCDARKESLIEATNTCECNSKQGWTGNVGSCVCNEAKGWEISGDGCACPDGEVPVNGTCETKAVCVARQKWIEDTNICVCNWNYGWTGPADNCVCDETNHWLYNTEMDACVCDESHGWTRTDHRCSCLIHKYDEKTKAYTCVTPDQLKQGDVITFGWSDISKYDDRFNTSYNADQLQWIVLEENDGNKGAYVLSKKILMNASYDDPSSKGPENLTWILMKSSLYDQLWNIWTKSFTGDERGRIQDNFWTEADGQKIAGPLILLSESEAKKYLKLESIEGFVINDDLDPLERGWWLRTLKDPTHLRMSVVSGDSVADRWVGEKVGVRPAMYIK